VVGFYVLESKETPGLGDKIEKDENFLANFKALDVSLNEEKTGLKNDVVPVKNGTKKNPWEVDSITGATISSRAIADIINTSMHQWGPQIQKYRESLMNKSEKQTDESDQ
jgi:electron transport complex protein RnfG